MRVYLTQREGNPMPFAPTPYIPGAPSASGGGWGNSSGTPSGGTMTPEEQAAYDRARLAYGPTASPAYGGADKDLAPQFAGDISSGGNVDDLKKMIYNRDVARTDNAPTRSDPAAYYLGGEQGYAKERATMYDSQAVSASMRGPELADRTVANGFADKAGASAGNLEAQANLQGLVAGGLIGGADGAGYQGQLNAAGQQMGAGASQLGQAGELAALGKMPVGPSLAELQMRQASGLAQNQQASLAASARGGNSALALQNAAANSAQIGGQLEQNAGIQRASEDMANRTFAANAIRGAADIYGGAGQTFGGAGGSFNDAAQGRNNALTAGSGAIGQATTATNANVTANTTLAQNAAQQAQQDADTKFRMMQQNDAIVAANQARSDSITSEQTGLTAGLDKATADRSTGVITNAFNNRDRTGEGTVSGSKGMDTVLAAGATAAGAVLGGPAGAAAGSAVVPAAASVKSSDIRAKKNIQPAAGDIDEMFRSADATAARTNAIAPVDYGFSKPALPAYSYDYKDPSAPGADPGRHFGPMAQDLEKTPAGASVVVNQGGKKGIDTGRLSLANASETARLRAQVDALMGASGPAAQMQGTQVSYPQTAPQPPPRPQANGYGMSDLYNPWREDQDPRLRPFPGARA